MTKRLGRGLAEIIDSTTTSTESLVMLRTGQIRPGAFQPRSALSEEGLEELKASIKRSGVIEPVIVRPSADGVYELVAGERRLRATQALGIPDIPAIVKPLSDKEAVEFSLIENVQRENLNPLEEAKGYARLLGEFGYTQEDIAVSVGKDRATIANLLRLLALPEEIQSGVSEQAIAMGHARALLSVADRTKQMALYWMVREKGLSVRQTEALASAAFPERRRRRPTIDPHLREVEDKLRRTLGTKVNLVARKKGGRIVIEYFSSEDLARIVEALGGSG